MKNYEEMSDSQIAQKVFFFVSSNLCPKGGLAHISSDGFFFFDDKNIKQKFDPCNNPADAWPIIEKYRISILDQLTEWCVDAKGVSPIFDTRPLRAAMIVFLKMNEDKL
jgi:hypothetical protein